MEQGSIGRRADFPDPAVDGETDRSVRHPARLLLHHLKAFRE
jgi:hypothetical protein